MNYFSSSFIFVWRSSTILSSARRYADLISWFPPISISSLIALDLSTPISLTCLWTMRRYFGGKRTVSLSPTVYLSEPFSGTSYISQIAASIANQNFLRQMSDKTSDIVK